MVILLVLEPEPFAERCGVCVIYQENFLMGRLVSSWIRSQWQLCIYRNEGTNGTYPLQMWKYCQGHSNI